MAEKNGSCRKILFQSRSICDRNTSIGVKGLGNEALNRSNVFRCYSWFRDGSELVEGDGRGGRPKSTRTEVNIAADLFKNDSRITSRIIAESLNSPRLVLRIPKNDFCSRNFFLLRVNATAHKAASGCQFLNPKNVTTFYHPRTQQIYLGQTIFCSPSWNWSWKDSILWMLLRSRKPNRWIKEGPKRGNFGSSSETVRPRKRLYICQWSLFGIKKLFCGLIMCLAYLLTY
jgi:hypothetical protein